MNIDTNNVSKSLAAMMRDSGLSYDDFKKFLIKEVDAQEKAAYEEALAKEKAKKAEDNKRKVMLEERSKKLCDIANRALANSLTADDVAYIQQLYIHSKYPNAPHSVLDEMLDGKSIDSIIKITIKAAEDFTPMLEMMGTTWDHVMKNITREDKDKAINEAVKEINEVSKHDKDKSDDIIITKFLRTL